MFLCDTLLLREKDRSRLGGGYVVEVEKAGSLAEGLPAFCCF